MPPPNSPPNSPPQTPPSDFDLQQFLPYLLNQAAEATSLSFQPIYRDAYGLTRTQWRVLANLGKFGAATARDICRISHIDKTKVSRAVAALESEGLLARTPGTDDRRTETLTLTPQGAAVFATLGRQAVAYDRQLRQLLGEAAAARLQDQLCQLIALQSGPAPQD